ncbi:MAG TPA: hypothetical protein VEV85_04095 [Bryobacteraceae bacterium]|nr:hypothetical protein [Bryobacteraceae bacterium]
MDSQPVQTTTSEAASVAAASPSKPKTPLEAAKQFESLPIAQMLRTARESMGGDDSDSTAETMFDVAGQQLEEMLADPVDLGFPGLLKVAWERRAKANESLYMPWRGRRLL